MKKSQAMPRRLAAKKSRTCLPRANQRGVVLITSLFILVIVTLLAVAMYRSIGLQGKIAGNTLEKQRSLQAAETALNYGEWWLNQGNAGRGAPCSGIVGTARICSDPLPDPAKLPWAASTEYTPPGLFVNAGGGLAKSLDVNYAKTPSFHVSYLGIGPDGKSSIYQVTGAAYGGSDSTVSVVQSTYAMTARSIDLGGL